MSENPKHLTLSNEHYTPTRIIEASRAWMGGIDLDPASCEPAQRRVRAKWWFAKSSGGRGFALGGIGLPWRNWTGEDDAMPPLRVFLNPPGGGLKIIKPSKARAGDPSEVAIYKRMVAQRYGTMSHTVAWWLKLNDEITHGNVRQAVFIGFSLELLQAAQGFNGRSANILKDCHICIPEDRLQFVDADGNPGEDPTHGSVIIGIGGDGNEFEKHFSAFGWCRQAVRRG